MTSNQSDSEQVSFDQENGAYIVPAKIMDDIFSLLESLEPESSETTDASVATLQSSQSSQDSTTVTPLKWPPSIPIPSPLRWYCCEFYPVANGDPKKLIKESFKSLPGLANVRCAAIAAQYLQPSSKVSSGRC
jgi:hypothetical protein